MKRFSIITILLFSVVLSFSQKKINRTVVVKPFIDTTTVEFRNIFGLWESYMDTLSIYNIKAHYKIKRTNESINSFWTEVDIKNYTFPDIAYSVTAAAMSFYPLEKEYFLGFAHRDTNLFELKTMFVNLNEEVSHNTPDIIISQPVIKKGNTYKLYNKFSWLLNSGKIIKKKLGYITYYYSPLYKFNNKKATLLADRIQKFVKGFQIREVPEIKYLVGDNMTELYGWLGIDYYNIDFNATLMSQVGRAVPLNNMILSGNGGENYLHEIIHILLKGIRKGKYGFFEEGIACYFGEHVGHSYTFHVKRLKRYFEKNKWIDLSENLESYYKNAEINHSYKPLRKDNPSIDYKGYGDDTTYFTYIINAALCDMAFRKGGYDLVKKMLEEKADNVEEFYPVIEKYLGIKRKDVDKDIKSFIENNF